MALHTRIAIASNFTAEPIKRPFEFWLQQMNLDATVSFAPYNQVFQQLLDENGLFAQNGNADVERSINIILLRLEDWLGEGTRGGSEGDGTAFYSLSAIKPALSEAHSIQSVAVSDSEEQLKRTGAELVKAIEAEKSRSSTSLLVAFCPSSPQVMANATVNEQLSKLESTLAGALDEIGGVYPITSSALKSRYTVADYYDPHADRTGHIPYAEAFFTALATHLARRVRVLVDAPFKVAILDCDNTLWTGVCGEVGAMSVEIDDGRRAFQEKLCALTQKGWLLCLCSKNVEEDVFDVFDQNPGMAIKRDHLAGWRINWTSKAENIRSLAAELNLGLDSFVFIDDNPVECAEVRALLPEVLTLQVPEETESLGAFFDNVWAFDGLKYTGLDKNRTQQYKENARRESFRSDTLSLTDFLAGLELQIEITQPAEENVPRIAQLTQRTNQFNTTTMRRNESEIQGFLKDQFTELRIVSVKDRFGDYGLVGLMIFLEKGDALTVDTMLLSCRALGRGVEQAMLMELGKYAAEKGLKFVDVRFSETAKNKPAQQFLKQSGTPEVIQDGDTQRYRYPLGSIHSLEPLPLLMESKSKSTTQSVTGASPEIDRASERWQHVAMNFRDIDSILKAIRSQSRLRPDLQNAFVEPSTPLERQIAAIWQEVMHLDRVGVQDGFKELGGTSLQAVQIHSLLKQRLDVEFSLTSLFALPTIQAITSELSSTESDEHVAANIQDRAARQKAAMAQRRNLRGK